MTARVPIGAIVVATDSGTDFGGDYAGNGVIGRFAGMDHHLFEIDTRGVGELGLEWPFRSHRIGWRWAYNIRLASEEEEAAWRLGG